MNTIALALDLELNQYQRITEVIEFGFTEVDLVNKKLIRKLTFPVRNCLPINKYVEDLTGWTNARLNKQGTTFSTICDKLLKNYGSKNRLIIVDSSNELDPIKRQCEYLNVPYPFGNKVLNVSDLFQIKYGEFKNLSLEDMLDRVGLEFVGTPHRAHDDSYNIGRLFLKVIE